MRWVRYALLLLLASSAEAQEKLDITADGPELAALANTRWSQIYPEFDFEGGCLMGFFTFRFNANGYFTFHNRVQGSWRIDERGIVHLRTRSGVRFMLMMEQDQLRIIKPVSVTAGLTVWTFRRNGRFQKCPNE
jgi:hypothetical protein